MPSILLMVNTLVGGTLAAAGANTLNSYIDRDIDQLMHRTSRRPLVTGEVAPRQAITFGIVLGVIATIYLGLLVNPPSAVLAVAAILFYVFVYTLGLKRRTPQNIVWGGAAGCMPVLIGWAAVTNSLSYDLFVQADVYNQVYEPDKLNYISAALPGAFSLIPLWTISATNNPTTKSPS